MADTGSTDSSYLAGRREWMERYGGYIARARQWRMVAVIALGTAAVSVAGVVVLASQVRVVPYVVEVDGKGRAKGVYPAERLDGGTPALVRAAIARWIEDWRLVTADATVQRAAIDRVYAHLAALGRALEGLPVTVATASCELGEWIAGTCSIGLIVKGASA